MVIKSSISELDAQVDKPRKRNVFRSLNQPSVSAATKSGLAEIEITDEQIDRIFEEIAGRFRKVEKKETASPMSACLIRTTNLLAGIIVETKFAGIEIERRRRSPAQTRPVSIEPFARLG